MVGAHDGNNIFKHSKDNEILPCIKVRKNANVRWKKEKTSLETYQFYFKNDLQKWKDSVIRRVLN